MRPRALLALLLGILLGALVSTHAAAQTLADDSRAYHLVTVTLDPPTPACVRLQSALRDPAVAPIAAQTKRFDFKPTDAIYRTRYASALSAAQAPILALVRWDGGVIYKTSGDAIPSPPKLAAELRRWAMADRDVDPAAINQAGVLPRFPDRPRLIPDSVTISPQINIPPGLVAGVVLLLLAFAVFAALFLLGLWLLIRTPTSTTTTQRRKP
jgi:hypothetical protein